MGDGLDGTAPGTGDPTGENIDGDVFAFDRNVTAGFQFLENTVHHFAGGADAAAESSDRGVPAPAASGPPPGFYAIVGSARQAEGIRDLVRSLEESGFATQVQRFPDEAGRTWTRGLVGPYRSRSEAEAAARQLLRERRLEAWVTEIAAERRAGEEPI